MRKLKLEELGRIGIEDFKSIDKIPIVVVIDNIRSAMNVGSFFRTSDAFKIEKLVLCGITATPPHKEILKTAIGASSSVDWTYGADIAEALKDLKGQNYEIIGIEQTDESQAMSSYHVDTSKKYALVFGNEVKGISDAALPSLDVALEIPQFGTKHSLNVSVCGGIVIWYFAKQFL